MLKEHKKEMQRWLENSNEASVWVKGKIGKNTKWFNSKFDESSKWIKLKFEDCGWDENRHYIIDDEQAELRMLQIDEPNTRFEYYDEYLNKWIETTRPAWHTNIKYRVKQDPIFKVSGKGTNEEFVVKFTGPTVGEVVFAMPDSTHKIGDVSDKWYDHSREDCWKDVSYNPERKLYDKQPIICWDNNMEAVKIVGFYDGKNDGVFNVEGYRDGFEYENYAPYPHPDDEFITEMYRKLEE